MAYGNKNSKILWKNVLGSATVKGCSLCVSLAATPALIRYFGNHTVLGVWYTLLSLAACLLNFDFGIGNGIRNQLAKDLALQDLASARKTISSGMISGVLPVMVLAAAGPAAGKIDLNWLFRVEEHVISHAVLVESALLVFSGILVRCFLSWICSVLYALQMASVNSFLGLCVSVLQFLFVILVKPENPEQGLRMLAGAYAVILNIPVCLAGGVVFRTQLRECRPSVRHLEKQALSSILGTGRVFFLCQITYMLLMNTNQVLISRFFGPEYAAEYTLYEKFTGFLAMAAALVLTPIWSMITRALAEGQQDWVRRLYKRLKIAGVLTMAVQFAFLPVQQFVMNLWLGKDVFSVSFPIAFAFACFGSVFLYTTILSTMVCGMSRMKIQALCFSAGVVGKIAVILMLAPVVQHWSVVVWSNVFVLLPYCIIQQADLDRFFRNL